MSIKVLYHCPCVDGAFSALSAYVSLVKHQKKDVTFIGNATYKPYDLDKDPHNILDPTNTVYLLDFIGNVEFVPRILKKVKKVVIIDHHKTGKESIAQWKASSIDLSNAEIHMDMEHSAAKLCYDYFAPTPAPSHLSSIIPLVEDQDLYRFQYEDTKAFHAGLNRLGIDYQYQTNPSVFEQLLGIKPGPLIASGRDILARNQAIIDKELSESFPIVLGGQEDCGKCLAVITLYPHLRSDMGHYLAVKSAKEGYRDMGAVIYFPPNDTKHYKISLRSNGDEDTTKIAKMFGGGGHLNASSFLLPFEDFAQWKVLP